MALPEGIDTSSNRPAYPQVAFLGKSFVARYIGPGSGKLMTSAEFNAIRAAGLAVVFLAEGFEQDALLGYDKGVEHANQAAYDIRTKLWPRDRPVYFAVDFDMQVDQRPAVRAYLSGCTAVLGLDRVGVYGGIRTTEWAWANRYASWFFQTYAWSAGEIGAHTDLYQYRNNVPFAGGVVDLCRGMSTDYGQTPHALETIGAAPATPPPPVTSGPWDFIPGLGAIAGTVQETTAVLYGAANATNQLRR